MSWYRRYRPRTIAGLHLAKVRTTFQKLMDQGKLPQVLLFAGSKGTGKTSTSRIIAAMVNDPANADVVGSLFLGKPTPKNPKLQEPNPDQEVLKGVFEGSSWMVQELDAASNRGIDDVRAIKEKVNLPPQAGLMTVYIFDEVHMLTTEAFNALLKLLEEPPAHVIFILATTELHKIPATITSRATVIEFQPASVAELSEALTQVLTAEKVKFEPAAVTLIAQSAEGSFRDAVKLAEQLSTTLGELTEKGVAESLQTSVNQEIKDLLVAVVNKQPKTVVEIFQALRQKQANPDQVSKLLFTTLHQAVMQNVGVVAGKALVSQPAALFLLQELQTLPVNSSPIPLLHIEIKLLDLIARSQQKTAKTESTGPTTPPTKAAAKAPPIASPKVEAAPAPETIPSSVMPTVSPDLTPFELPSFAPAAQPEVIAENPRLVVSDNLQPVSAGDSSLLLSQWEKFVDLVRAKNSSLAALLKSAEPLAAEGGTATIAVYYKFHKEQLTAPKFAKMIEDCVAPLIGGQVKLEFVLKEHAVPAAGDSASTAQTSAKSDTLSSLAEELLV